MKLPVLELAPELNFCLCHVPAEEPTLPLVFLSVEYSCHSFSPPLVVIPPFEEGVHSKLSQYRRSLHNHPLSPSYKGGD